MNNKTGDGRKVKTEIFKSADISLMGVVNVLFAVGRSSTLLSDSCERHRLMNANGGKLQK